MIGGLGSILFGAPTLFLSSVSHPAVKNALGLIPPLAMAEAMSVALDFELSNESLTWAKIAEHRHGFSFLNGLLFLALDIILYFLFALYLYQITPEQGNGATKHPLFCLFQNTQKWSMIGLEATESPLGHEPEEDTTYGHGLLEDPTPELQAMQTEEKVSLQGISKTYTSSSGASVPALESVTFDMFSGEVFTLLGENGAGKTTTISLLTGSAKATSGSASVLGLDLASEMDSIRSFTGYCPQHDTVYKSLSCLENLAIFGGLKRVSIAKAEEILLRLGLWEKRNEVKCF
jgi:ATP-binding cassette subfamily A (ABC1) protein 3